MRIEDLPVLQDGDRWLTTSQVASQLGVSVQSIYAYASKGISPTIPFPKPDAKLDNGRCYWKKSTIDTWFSSARSIVFIRDYDPQFDED
ncbi:helix-turn-helix domain-containing protein [Nonomuraea sp. NPDC048881]|uniref:helix-turn-helix transcriptional regulator n=1 Tax=Nonomuraea sp. NPDC048881 TaxID=3155030 RepID=UPI0033F61AD8